MHIFRHCLLQLSVPQMTYKSFLDHRKRIPYYPQFWGGGNGFTQKLYVVLMGFRSENRTALPPQLGRLYSIRFVICSLPFLYFIKINKTAKGTTSACAQAYENLCPSFYFLYSIYMFCIPAAVYHYGIILYIVLP